MDCENCANTQAGCHCRTMIKKPKEKWCYRTKIDAIKAEKAIIDYIDIMLPKADASEIKQLGQWRKWALNHIARLERMEG